MNGSFVGEKSSASVVAVTDAVRSPKAQIEMLAAVPLLSACSKKELRQIAGLCTAVKVRDGATLTEQGRLGREFFLIIEGTARCMVDGTEVASFGPGTTSGRWLCSTVARFTPR